MSRPSSSTVRLSLSIILTSVTVMSLVAVPVQAQQPLSFFKNYFLTGDYVVRGVSLWRKGVNGTAVANIPKLGGTGGVPATSDIVAAFLYVQTAESVQGTGIEHATFMGIDLGPYYQPGSTEPGSGTFAKQLVDWDVAQSPCWSVNFPGGRKLITYRIDAFRFLPIDPATGKQDLTKPFRVTVPDAGRLLPDVDESGGENTATALPRAIGASLLVVYRDPTKPFAGISIYDGAWTKRAYARMDQTLEGWYQAASLPAARMTHIVGDGRPFLFEQVLVNGQVIALNPYVSANGPKWDNPTLTNLPVPAGAASMNVRVDRLGFLSDCVTFSAMIARTNVQDSDNDGLVDAMELTPPPNDPTGIPLPDLAAMGASPTHKDLFTEIGYMYAAGGTTYGGVAKPAHSHLPTEAALTKAAGAFNAAPVPNPDGTTGIRVHFDIGGEYQAPNIDPNTGLEYPPLPSDCATNWQPRCAIIPASLARGGERISETRACADPADPVHGKPIECATFDQFGNVTSQQPIPGQYPEYPGTVGWKTGFQLLRDELLGFDQNRKDTFHYLLGVHAVAIPKEACQNPDGTSNLTCQDTNPDFHVPRTYSGIADFPGGDVLLAMGAFDDELGRPVGTDHMVGATIMHELGHTFELTHAGLQSLDPLVPREPNCKPHYHSVMNYLYQLRGLYDTNGKIQMDYSGEGLALLNENLLLDDFLAPLGMPRYRSGWYAPWETSYLKNLANPATKHCDGSDLLKDANGTLLEVPMVRVDAPSVGEAIDWDANGQLNVAAAIQDINFNGTFTSLNPSTNDWANIRLNQLGSRRSPGGYYTDALGRKAVGPMSLDIGRGDIGRGDIGRGDIGRGDIGSGDIGRGDIGIAIGRGDIGRGDIGRGDIGRGDIGRGDIGRGDIGRGVFGGGDLDVGGANEPFGEIDLETARAVSGDAPSPANELQACLTSDGECAVEGGDRPVLLSWTAPHLAQVASYTIYRFEYDPEAVFPPGTLPTDPLDTIVGEFGVPTSYVDDTAPAGVSLAYFVVANFGDGTSSGISNFAQVTTPAGVLPDLVVNLTHYPTIPTTLDLITATATVTNAGPVVAAPSWLEFCVGGETPGPNGNCRHTQIPALAPGASFTDTREDTLSVVEGYANHIVADYLGEVPESNDENNTVFDQYAVVAASGFPVSGNVLYSTVGLAGITVELGQAPPPVGFNTPPLRRTTTGDGGAYSFSLVPSGGEYWVKVYGPTSEYITWIARTGLTVTSPGLVLDMDLPRIITLLTPAANATGVSLTPTLTWTGLPEATRYVVQINASGGGQWILIAQTDVGNTTSYTVPTGLLAPGTEYTWQVSGYDGLNHYVGATENSFRFTTTNQIEIP